MSAGRATAAAALAALLLSAPCEPARGDGLPGGDPHLLIVTGLGGEAYYDDLFHRWADTLVEVARERLRLPRSRIVRLAPDPGRAPEAIDGVSSKAALLTTMRALAERAGPGDPVVVVLIGHGTATGNRARFNLPGPDLGPDELAGALDGLGARPVVVVNTSSASAPFMPALAAPGRIVITATSSASENQASRFGGHFVAAFAEEAADGDKDRQVSLLEAFRYASAQVRMSYESEGRLRTEHAMLDDSGDGVGTQTPSPDGDDGPRAARMHLAAIAPGEDAASTRGRARLALAVEARRLVDRIEALKRLKPGLDEDVYARRLETLLLELALNRRAYRAQAAP